jgi:hypothetical protein
MLDVNKRTNEKNENSRNVFPWGSHRIGISDCKCNEGIGEELEVPYQYTNKTLSRELVRVFEKGA